ncbi:hypothetical protein BAOM_3135 [Peribacillus asahii]|uniref:Peptidase S74 domain-containing protein n=1 Tax=Peribacillus asahii TaxID=228899 RepID=A0A3Q9RNQ9_9BACI|nr:phage tail spike protein [Peribacillus asahii]AZV43744.1 hypothetical protein BAOM_3135 [Peribacillus asahii]
MRLGTIDLSLKPQKPKLSICKPNRVKIGELTEAYNIKHDVFLGKVSELSFTIPYLVEDKHELVGNPNIDKLKDRYLIKLELGNLIEWYIINDVTDSSDETKDDKNVHCYSLAWQLNDKLIRGLEETSVNATSILNTALLGSTWGIGYIDSDFDIRFRSFEVSESTVLDFIFQVADTFATVVEFNTVNRSVSLKKEESIGTNKGLRLSYGKYLQTLSRQSNSDEMVTRFHVFGNENLSIQNLNMTGTTFLENFSYFLYPFKMDENENIISHSYYMSDNLCKAQIKYQDLIVARKPTFKSYLTQLEQHQTTLFTKETEMTTLQNELNIIEDKIYIAKGMEEDTSTLDAQKTTKNNEIANKQTEINNVKAQITTVNNNISALRAEIAVENNFTVDEIKERNDFIIEKTWQDDNFIDEQDLYDEAIRRFEELKAPKTTFNIDIINFLNVIEEQRNWNKLSIGDTVTINYELLGVNITAKIIEIHFDYESDNISLTISNTADILDEATKLAKKIYDSYSTSTSLDMSKYKWNESAKKMGEVNEIINSEWDATKREISAGVNNSISISGRGIVITNPDDPLKQLIAQSGVLALTMDGGNTWKTAIKPDKIVAEVVMGKLITGVNLVIENQSGTYTIDGNGFNITRSDDKVKIGINVSDGIKIQAKDVYGQWKDKFYADTNGNLTFSGTLSGADGTFSGTVSAGKIIGGTMEATDITGGSINIGNGNFTVNSSGEMVAKSGEFSGTIIGSIIKSSDKNTSLTINAGSMKVESSLGAYVTVSPNGIVGYDNQGAQKYSMDANLVTSTALATVNKNVYLGTLQGGEVRVVDAFGLPSDGAVGSYSYRNLRCRDVISHGNIEAEYIASKGALIAGGDLVVTGDIFANQGAVATQTWVQQQGYSTGISSSPVFNSVTADIFYGREGGSLAMGWDGQQFFQSTTIYNRTYSSDANIYITSFGTLGRSTSASKYKLNIEEYNVSKSKNILDLTPKTWFDKTATEQYAEYLTKISPVDIEGNPVEPQEVPEMIDIPYMETHTGLIAEDVEAVGLSEFVTYGAPDENGNREVEGLEYSRLWVLLIPLVKEQQTKIEELEQRLIALEG